MAGKKQARWSNPAVGVRTVFSSRSAETADHRETRSVGIRRNVVASQPGSVNAALGSLSNEPLPIQTLTDECVAASALMAKEKTPITVSSNFSRRCIAFDAALT